VKAGGPTACNFRRMMLFLDKDKGIAPATSQNWWPNAAELRSVTKRLVLLKLGRARKSTGAAKTSASESFV
jgi:hypothetical protein